MSLMGTGWQISAKPTRRTIELCLPIAKARAEAEAAGTIKLLEALVAIRKHRVAVKKEALERDLIHELELRRTQMETRRR